jgi:DNA-binding response OmpR family regulator
MMSQILVVSTDHAGLTDMLGILNGAGYMAMGASTFQEAARFLSDQSPDLVIADGRLGAFNGLHIILRARAKHADVSGIVTSPVPDRGLEDDARDLNVWCLVKPRHAADWLETVSRTLQPNYTPTHAFASPSAMDCLNN